MTTHPALPMPNLGLLTCRYYHQPTTCPQSIVIVITSKGSPWLVWEQRGRASRVDYLPAGQSWPDAAAWVGIDDALARSGRSILVFAMLLDARACWCRLLSAGVRT